MKARNADETARLTPRETLLSAKEFLRSLSQTAKLMTLYDPKHPVPTSSLQETWDLLKRAFAEARGGELTFALVEGRWLVNGSSIPDASAAGDALQALFQARTLDSVTFLPGVLLYEFAAFCELAALPASHPLEVELADWLKQKGVRSVRVDTAEYARRRPAEPATPPTVESPIPHGRAAGGHDHGVSGPAAGGFGAFIKNLVEESVRDPDERAKIYEETVRMVKQSLDRRVAEQTVKLKQERQRALGELMRTEQVLSALAEGKVTVDSDGRVMMMDQAAEEILGKRLVDVAGKPILESVRPSEQIASLSKDMVLDPDKPGSGGVRVVADESVAEAYRQSMAVVQDEKGRVVGTYGVLPYVAKFKEFMRMQEEFVSNITHDLKAPLASICSALELIEQNAAAKLGPDERKFLEISRRNSTQLKLMIDEILDFSKLESGKMSIRPVPTRVRPLVLEAVDGLRPWASSRKLELAVLLDELPQEGVMVLADPRRLVQILTNLLSNAIKSTPEGGRIWVAAGLGKGSDKGAVVLSVKDTGCGIPQKEQTRIFEKFVQLEKKELPREGVGLGLTIVKALVGLHKGRVWFESQEGRGSTFYVSLPLAR